MSVQNYDYKTRIVLTPCSTSTHTFKKGERIRKKMMMIKNILIETITIYKMMMMIMMKMMMVAIIIVMTIMIYKMMMMMMIGRN